MKHLHKVFSQKQNYYINLTLNVVLIILIIAWVFTHSDNRYLQWLLGLLKYKNTKSLVNIVEICGIFTIIFSLIKYLHSEKQDKFLRTVNIMSNIRNVIYSVSAQNRFDKAFNNSELLIFKEICNKSFLNYIRARYGENYPLTKATRSFIYNKISNKIRISEKELKDKAELRVIGNIIVQLNIWALYINQRSVDMSLVNTQIQGDILGFLKVHKHVYWELKRSEVPLTNLRNLVHYWLK